MAQLNTAENLSPESENSDHQDAAKQNPEKQDMDINQLTPNDRKRLENKEVTTKQIVAELIQHKAAAEAELKRLTTIQSDTEEGTYLDMNDYKNFAQRIKDTKSPEDAKNLVDEIQEYPATKRAQNKKDNEKREMDDPALKPHIDKIENLFKRPDVKAWVGSKQVASFREWCMEAIKKEPSIKTAKDILYKLNNDRNGLKPRQEFYERTLGPKLKKYGISLSDTPYLEREGLSERTEAFKAIEDAEKKLEGMRNTGLYSFKAKQKMIQDMLKGDGPGVITRLHKQTTDVIRNESTQFTNQSSSIFKNTMVTVHGVSVRAMSDASVKVFLNDYKEYDLQTRADTVLHWAKIVENEGKLVKDLGDIYEKDPEGFKKALKSFAALPYMQKEKALKEHKRMIDKNDKEIVHESLNILHKSVVAIDEAKDKGFLSNRTANSFKKFVQNTSKYTNSKTGEVDLKKQQDIYEKMTGKTPIYEKENRNIAAYEAGQKKFSDFLKKFAKDNPDIDKQEIKDWQDEYEEGTFSERKQTYLKLKTEAGEIDKEREKDKKTEKKLKVSETDKNEAEKNSPERGKLIEAVKAYIEEKTPESVEKGLTAIYLYFAFSKAKITDDTEMKGYRDELEDLESQLGKNHEADDESTEQEMMDEAEDAIGTETNIDHELDELDYVDGASKLIEESERKHGNDTDARKRSKEDVLAHSGDDIEDDIIESFYDVSDKDVILNEEDTGDNIIRVNFNEKRRMTSNEREEFQDLVFDEQSRDFQSHGGTTKIEIEDNGRTLDKNSRTESLENRKSSVIDMIAAKIMSKRQKTEGIKSNAFSNIAEQAAAKRAAEQKVKDRVESKVKND